ncbi:MAG: peptidoglycan bridge formation glycyltransferase FemA/FemB family protein [Proteobacteria bacterium]|nr:peptidoglycan bridge formation glycyltransferase FemA/FemB family protein [Pseudomonadota bacterium]
MSFIVDLMYDRENWVSVLSEIGSYDFVHTHDFHRLSQLNEEGEPVLFVVRSDQGAVHACWPLLRRKIPDTDLCDLTSVYGYAGPIFSKSAAPDDCIDLMLSKMKDENNVAVFSRMHPIFIGDIANETSRGVRLSDVVVIPVSQTENVTSSYRGSHRREISAAYKAGVDVVVDHGIESLEKFVSIYQGAMLGLGASNYYFFNKEYFENLCAAEDFKVLIISAKLNDQFMASSLFIITGSIMQYYLSGSVAEFKKLAPSKVILAKAHEVAISLGCSFLILGGGVGSKQDALYKFKQGFSSLSMPFYVKKVVLDAERYEDLVRATGNAGSDDAFFPLYRRFI